MVQENNKRQQKLDPMINYTLIIEKNVCSKIMSSYLLQKLSHRIIDAAEAMKQPGDIIHGLTRGSNPSPLSSELSPLHYYTILLTPTFGLLKI